MDLLKRNATDQKSRSRFSHTSLHRSRASKERSFSSSRAKFKNDDRVAVADRAAFVSLTEELSDDSILEEARSCEDEEFLLFLLIRERQSHVRIENYFERIKPIYSVSDYWYHFRMSRPTVSCLERLLATCPGLPHGQRNGGRPSIDLQK